MEIACLFAFIAALFAFARALDFCDAIDKKIAHKRALRYAELGVLYEKHITAQVEAETALQRSRERYCIICLGSDTPK